MKPYLAVASGFIVSLGMFAGGAVLATSLLSADPVDLPRLGGVSDAWSAEPRAVDVAAQDFERLPPVAQPYDQAAADRAAEERAATLVADAGPLDAATTASIDGAEPLAAGDVAVNGQHLAWCSDRYRSYRQSDNTYQPYSGGRKPCVSPHVAGTTGTAGQALAAFAGESEQGSGDGTLLGYASDTHQPQGDAAYASDHIRDCFSRYRSYRVSDNSYQPYGGGPRRQCD